MKRGWYLIRTSLKTWISSDQIKQLYKLEKLLNSLAQVKAQERSQLVLKLETVALDLQAPHEWTNFSSMNYKPKKLLRAAEKSVKWENSKRSLGSQMKSVKMLKTSIQCQLEMTWRSRWERMNSMDEIQMSMRLTRWSLRKKCWLRRPGIRICIRWCILRMKRSCIIKQ